MEKPEVLLQQIPYREEDARVPEDPVVVPEPSADTLRRIMGNIDLTTLDVKDTDEKVADMCRKVNDLPVRYPEAGQVAGVCVYPVFISVVRKTLKAEGVQIVSVSGGFPAAQTYREVKIQETEMALAHGATEIDIVIPVGKILAGKINEAWEEVRAIREVIGSRGHLKVILESGVLEDPEMVHRAAVTAMAAGADFIKTSTGKVSPAARPQDMRVMAAAVRRFYEITGKKVGIKPAGGIATAEDALLYAGIVEKELGEEWLSPRLFRIGASRLANNLLTAIYSLEQETTEKISYF